MRFSRLFLTFMCLTVPVFLGGVAGAMTPEDVAARLFGAEVVDKAWFSNEGLASAVPHVIEELQDTLGPLRSIAPCAEKCVALFERGEVSFNIIVDVQDLISTILIDVPILYATSMEEALEQFSELPGKISIFVERDEEPIANLDADSALAVGSAFKLAVLKALYNLIGAGKLEWDQVVLLKDEWGSLPSGKLHEWPIGSPITLHTLASLMISISDNTATDALIDIVTRSSVEMISPRNRPFLTTREFFQFKHRDHGDLRDRYQEGNFDQRMSILNTLLEKPLPRLNELTVEPLHAFEWHFSTRELCALMTDLQDLDVLQINPGVARKTDWDAVSFKGGGDAGVVNLTTGLLAEDGTRHCVSATWNDDEAVDMETFAALYASVLHQLRTAQ